MSNQTISEQLALERLSRKHERHLRFLRHSPREERWLPFVESRQETVGDKVFALLGIAILAVGGFLALGLQ